MMAASFAKFANLASPVRRRLLANTRTYSSVSSMRMIDSGLPRQVLPPRLQHPARRKMVVVTQSKASDPPQEQPNDENGSADEKATAEAYISNSDVLIVTESCMGRIEKLVEQKVKAGEDGDKHYLRVYVDAGGCSGFQYKFEMDSEDLLDDDVVIRSTSTNIPRLVVDETSLDFIRGSKVDYVQEMIKSSFEISENPLSESACGCGSSFAVKNFTANPAID